MCSAKKKSCLRCCKPLCRGGIQSLPRAGYYPAPTNNYLGSVILDTLISNVTVVTMNEKMDVLFGAYIGIENGKIAYMGKDAPTEQPKTIIDGTGMVAMPGLINCHTHLATAVLRNFVDDGEKREALEQLLTEELVHDEQSIEKTSFLSGIRKIFKIMDNANEKHN